MNTPSSFMIIDDDAMNNFICKAAIKNVVKEAALISFEKPVEALEYIKTYYKQDEPAKTYILLDINMPVLTGWEFLEELEKNHSELLPRFLIYILSSSIDARDMKRAEVNPNMVDFISKPLTKEAIKRIVGL